MDPASKNIEDTKQSATSMVNPYSTEPTSNIESRISPNSDLEMPISYTSDSLKSGDKLLEIPDVPTDTSMAGASGDFESLAAENAAYMKSLTDQEINASKSTASAFDQYLAALSNSEDVDTLTFKAEQEAGLPAMEQEVNRLNAELMGEQRALKKKIDLINANSGGGLASGVAGEIANAQRESYSKQADIAVVQMAAQGRFDSAQKWAQRKAAIQFSARERALTVREKIYEANKAAFEKAGDRAYLTKTEELKRRLQDEKDSAAALSAAKLEALKMAQMNSAPIDVLRAIQEAKTPEEVISMGGQYGSVDMLQRAVLREQLTSLRSKPEALRPTQVIDQAGRKLLIDTQSGEVLKDFGNLDASASDVDMAVTQTKIADLDALKAHPGLYKSVGPTSLARWTPFRNDVWSGDVAEFTGKLNQLTEGLALDNLLRAKESGATFGALSDGERAALAASATAINSWKRTRDDGSIYYEVGEKAFLKEMDKVSNFAKLDALNKGADPASIGVAQMEDGTLWAQNADGSMTQLK